MRGNIPLMATRRFATDEPGNVANESARAALSPKIAQGEWGANLLCDVFFNKNIGV